jgi:Carboxypeptidase regulatory-like domain
VKTHRLTFFLLLAVTLAALPSYAQKRSQKQQPTTGGISGRVRVDSGATPSDVTVHVRRDDADVAETKTNSKGEFEVQGLAPGSYGLVLRKTGLQVGRLEGVEVRAGKTVSLKSNLFLPVDEGSIAHLRGSVFNAEGRSLGGARVEIARIEEDGSLRKIDDRVSNGYGQFAFRLPPARARYRVTAKADGMQTSTQDVEIDGAAIFRVALTLNRAQK